VRVRAVTKPVVASSARTRLNELNEVEEEFVHQRGVDALAAHSGVAWESTVDKLLPIN
jgi:hypothetical protein